MSHVIHHPSIRATGMTNARRRGFTLVELMVVVSISAILAAVAIPQFSYFVGSRSIDAQVSAVVSSMRLARSEALKRATPVTICPSAAPEAANPQCSPADATRGWATGWLVFTDLGVRGVVDGSDTVIRVQSSFPGSGGMTPSTNTFTMTFSANGIMVGNAGGTFQLPNKASPSSKRCLIISTQGTSRQTTC